MAWIDDDPSGWALVRDDGTRVPLRHVAHVEIGRRPDVWRLTATPGRETDALAAANALAAVLSERGPTHRVATTLTVEPDPVAWFARRIPS